MTAAERVCGALRYRPYATTQGKGRWRLPCVLGWGHLDYHVDGAGNVWQRCCVACGKRAARLRQHADGHICLECVFRLLTVECRLCGCQTNEVVTGVVRGLFDRPTITYRCAWCARSWPYVN